MTSKFTRRPAALAAAVAALMSLASPAAATVEEQTMEWYSISRVAHPQQKGWTVASCPKAAMPYIIGARFSVQPFAKPEHSKFLEYTSFTQSADARRASMEFFDSQPFTTPWREQIGIQVKMGFTCSNVKPSVPSKPVFTKSAVLRAFSSLSLGLSCPQNLPTAVEADELHENAVIAHGPTLSSGGAEGSWDSMIPNDGIVDLLVRCGP